jgi:hypothetical protein
MLKFKDILYSKFKHLYPDLIEKDIIGPNEFTRDKNGFFSRFYQGLIVDIPNGVTYDNLQSVNCQLDQLYQSLYGQVDKTSKLYDSLNLDLFEFNIVKTVIVVRQDFDMQIYTDYTTKINFLQLNLRLDFVDRQYFEAKVRYYPPEECNENNNKKED